MYVSQAVQLMVECFVIYHFFSGSVGVLGSWDDLPVGVLVNDDSSVERRVALRSRSVPDVHAHARHLAIGWGGEVGIVGAAAILGVENNLVVSTTAGALSNCVSNRSKEEHSIDDLTLLLTSKLPAASLNPSVWRRSWYMLEV